MPYMNEEDNKYCRELPGTYSPAIMSILVNGYLTYNDISATILDFERRNIVKVEKVEETAYESFTERKYTTFNITKLDTDMSKLSGHELFFYDWLFNNLAVGGVLNINALNRSLTQKEHQFRQFNEDFGKWKNNVIQDAIFEGLLKQSRFKQLLDILPHLGINVLIIAFGIALFIFILFDTYLSVNTKRASPTDYLALIIPIVIIFVGGSRLFLPVYKLFTGQSNDILSEIESSHDTNILGYKISDFGKEQYSKWLGFKRFLDDYSLIEDASAESIIVWEQYLPYAASLGIANSVKSKLNINNFDLAYVDLFDLLCGSEYKQFDFK